MKLAFLVVLIGVVSFTTYTPKKESDKEFNTHDPVIDKIVTDFLIEKEIPNIAVGIIKNGRIVHVNAYGYTDMNNNVKATTSTVFRWASVSKILTAVAGLQLDEKQNDFSINDNVIEHVLYWGVPSLPLHPKNRMKIKDLLSHRSGIPHYARNVMDNVRARRYQTDQNGYNALKAVEVFNDVHIIQPNTQHIYTSYGYNLLGAAIEEATSGGYVKWIKDNIATPLGMQALTPSTATRSGYIRDPDGQWKLESVGNIEYKLPGGGWESTIGDMTRFAKGLLDGTLLDKTDRLWTKIQDNSGYGYGMQRVDFAMGAEEPDFEVEHGGSHGNLKTLLRLKPNKKFGIVFATWNKDEDFNTLYQKIVAYYDNSTVSRGIEESPTHFIYSGSQKGQFKSFACKKASTAVTILRKFYTQNAFKIQYDLLQDNNFQCVDLEPVYDKATKQFLWNGVFKKGLADTKMWRNFDLKSFGDKRQVMQQQGYEVIDIETYVSKGRRLWAGLFRKTTTPSILWRNFSTADFAAKRQEMLKQGKKLIDIEVFESKGELFWSGIWTVGEKEVLYRNMSKNEFLQKKEELAKQNYILADVERYTWNNQVFWAAIWEKHKLKGIWIDEQKTEDFSFSYNDNRVYTGGGRMANYAIVDLESY